MQSEFEEEELRGAQKVYGYKCLLYNMMSKAAYLDAMDAHVNSNLV